MKQGKGLAGRLAIAALVLGTAAGCSDSPTESGTPPLISELNVLGAQRVSGSVGVVFFNFDYFDPDGDVHAFVYVEEGKSAASTVLSDARETSGTIGVQQAVGLPAAGTEVPFLLHVIDRRGNRSNELGGVFVAPP